MVFGIRLSKNEFKLKKFFFLIFDKHRRLRGTGSTQQTKFESCLNSENF